MRPPSCPIRCNLQFSYDACQRKTPEKESMAAGNVVRARAGLAWHEATVLPQMQPDSMVQRHRPAVQHPKRCETTSPPLTSVTMQNYKKRDTPKNSGA